MVWSLLVYKDDSIAFKRDSLMERCRHDWLDSFENRAHGIQRIMRKRHYYSHFR
jgi:hypothetical protein